MDDERHLTVGTPANAAAGAKAVKVSMSMAARQMGPSRAARALLKLNQVDGFDCQGCAWPDPDSGHRHRAEFCENGAKAVAEEGTLKRVDGAFFKEHSVAKLERASEYWLGKQGRLVEPMYLAPGADRYRPVTWERAFHIIGQRLAELESPDEALFYTSGKTSNEAAFLYQLFARALGTNNLPDCSNMCHESTSVGLAEAIGIGKGSVSLQDVETAELIVVIGQNPGTNHPRMLSSLEQAKQNGARIIAVNPLREAGLTRFKNPQKVRGWLGNGTALADLHLPVRANGDMALFQAIGSLLLDWDAIDHAFIREHTRGFEDYVRRTKELDWDAIELTSGLRRPLIEEAARMFAESSATVLCWAMGVTQHKNSVDTVRELVNVALLQGNIGKPGAGLCPVRGHSNVQGNRTMGIWERVPDVFLDRLSDQFGFAPPRNHGLDSVDAVRALGDGRAKVFIGMGGNFVSAMPDSTVTEEAFRRALLTVHVSTQLNRSHVVHGREALILPALGRSEQDRTGGRTQRITVEDSMSCVHASKGPLKPASADLLSEVAIVTSVALATADALPPGPARTALTSIPWAAYAADYTTVRRAIAKVVPGAEGYDKLVDEPGGFVMPHPPRDSRTFETTSGRAEFSSEKLEPLAVPDGHLVLQTLRSHDQFNTTIYGLNDRYRGISQGRRVVFVHPQDIEELGFEADELVDIVSVFGKVERRVEGFRLVPYEQPRGCAAAYYPETNPLIPLDSTARRSNTPTSKSVIVRLDKPSRGSLDGAAHSATGV